MCLQEVTSITTKQLLPTTVATPKGLDGLRGDGDEEACAVDDLRRAQRGHVGLQVIHLERTPLVGSRSHAERGREAAPVAGEDGERREQICQS